MTNETDASLTRRSVLRSVAATSLAGGLGLSTYGSAAAEETADKEVVTEIYEQYAEELLSRLAEEGVLASGSIKELPIDRSTTGPDVEGVKRSVGNGEEVYQIRKKTDRGMLNILVRPETDDAMAALVPTESGPSTSLEDKLETYDSSGPISPQQNCTSCIQTVSCPLPPNLGIFCNGTFVRCCGA